MAQADSNAVPARFKVGDRVRVKDMPNIFYTRTQMTCGVPSARSRPGPMTI